MSPGNERGAGQGEELCLGQIGERIEMVLCSRQTSETTYLHICSSPKEMTNALRTSRCPSRPLPSSHREMPPGLLWVSTDQERGPQGRQESNGKGSDTDRSVLGPRVSSSPPSAAFPTHAMLVTLSLESKASLEAAARRLHHECPLQTAFPASQSQY